MLVSLNSTLQIVEYLCENINEYSYLMSKWINRDALELFYSILLSGIFNLISKIYTSGFLIVFVW